MSRPARLGRDSGPSAVGLLASTGYWLHRAALAHLRRLDASLRPTGLTHPQFQVLAAASWLNRAAAPTQQELATFAGVDRMLTSKTLQALQRLGLIERGSDEHDKRARRVTLTGRGEQVAAQGTAAARAVDAEVFGPPGELRGVLARIAGA